MFFQSLEESDDPFAKQTGPCPPSPINKRLITVLTPLLLAYTGARFNQLQDWQIRATLPAMKGRYMATLCNDLRPDLDCAYQNEDAIIAIKLDKSKAFDRIVFFNLLPAFSLRFASRNMLSVLP